MQNSWRVTLPCRRFAPNPFDYAQDRFSNGKSQISNNLPGLDQALRSESIRLRSWFDLLTMTLSLVEVVRTGLKWWFDSLRVRLSLTRSPTLREIEGQISDVK
jgi:hypothetical protein